MIFLKAKYSLIFSGLQQQLMLNRPAGARQDV
jgi:hypothetical protein